jgi:transcriptional regulator with XRE-family HTH domain
MIPLDDFPTMILTARKSRGLSREQVARRIGCNVASLTAWEQGHKPPPGDERLALLADALRLPLHDVARAACAKRGHVRLSCATPVDRELAAAFLLWLATANDTSRMALTAQLTAR